MRNKTYDETHNATHDVKHDVKHDAAYDPNQRDQSQREPIHREPIHRGEASHGRYAGHERQTHNRNHSTLSPRNDGYSQVPPGEEGQYGMRRSGPVEPWYNDPNVSAHSTNDTDWHYAQWRKAQVDAFDNDYREWQKERYATFSNEFEAWRLAQTSPGSNVGAPESGSVQRSDRRDGPARASDVTGAKRTEKDKQ